MTNSQASITQDEIETICQQIQRRSQNLPDDVLLAEESLMRSLVISVRSHLGYSDSGQGIMPVINPPTPSAPYWLEMQRIMHRNDSDNFDWTQVIRDNLLSELIKKQNQT